jgi:hypothetical protein
MKKSFVIPLILVVVLALSSLVSCQGAATKLSVEDISWPATKADLPGTLSFIDPDKPLTPSIMPVYFLSGDDYEMGYQYGYQAASYMNCFIDHLWAKFLARDFADTVAKRNVILKGFQYYVIEYAPYLIDHMIGIADGMTDAGYPTTYAEVLMMQCEWEANLDPDGETNEYPSPVDDLPPACSSFAAVGDATTEGQLVLGESADGTPFKHEGTIVAFPDDGNNYVVDGEIGVVGLNYAMNSEGVCIGLQASGSNRAIDYQFGFTMPFSFAHMARYADTAEEARDMLLDWELAWGTNYIMADPSGDMYVVEATASEKEVRWPDSLGEGEVDFLVSTNHFRTPEMVEFSGRDRRDCARYALLFDFLQKNQGDVDLDFAKMMWRNEPVLRTSSRMVRIAICDDDTNLSYTCTGPAWKVDGFRSMPIEPTHSFYEINLQDSPEATTLKAERTARDYIGMAMTEMNKLDYDDREYAVLNEIFTEAKAKYYEGINLKRSAQVTDGNESLFNFSKSMTAFTVSHVLSMQVYNALAGVPLMPADLKGGK